MKTLSTKPEQLRISFGEDPSSTMSIVWQTPAPTRQPTVQYGTSRALGMTAAATRPTYPYETGVLSEVRLRNLKPGTTYYYRVGDAEGGWSAVQRFRTGALRPSKFAFTAFGDQGVTAAAAQNVQNVLAEKPDFHVLLGDISYANGRQPVWDTYLQQIEPMTCTIPYMPTLGNHENETITLGEEKKRIGYVSYLARFALPGGEQWYSYDYGHARIVAFNSDDYNNPEQLVWLEKTLGEARRDPAISWLIVVQHHPPYGSSKGRDNNAGLIAKITPIYDKYGVDLVLCGHDHHYERHFPLRGGRITSTQRSDYRRGEGTIYLIQGGGGMGLYDFSTPIQPEICALRDKSNGYLRVTVERNQLTIEAKRVDRSRIETFKIRK